MMKQLVCISSCCLLTFVFLADFFYIKDTYFVQLLLLVFSLMIFIFIRPLKVGVCDICIILLGAYGLFLPSVNTINTNVMLVYLITNIFAYFILRYVFTYYGKFAGYLLSIYIICFPRLSIMRVLLRCMISGFCMLHWEFPIMYGVVYNGYSGAYWQSHIFMLRIEKSRLLLL